MKYIFDFDDVLFHTDTGLKEHIYKIYEKKGVIREKLQEYYEKVKGVGFSLKKQLSDFSVGENAYEEMMENSHKFVNHDVLNLVKKLNPQDCYILTFGDDEFQKDKIKRAGIEMYFKEVFVVQNSKKEMVEKICREHPDENVYFIDDKPSHFKDLELDKYPNLKTILYTGQDLNHILLDLTR